MQRYLYLLRHAQSAEIQGSQPDELRELTALGNHHAAQIGNFLFKNKNLPETILCSTAIRAKQTAERVASSIEFQIDQIQYNRSIYKLSINRFIDIIGGTDPALTSVMIVGHSPIISELVEYLTNQEIGNMSPASVAILEFDSLSWNEISQGTGKLNMLVSPDSL